MMSFKISTASYLDFFQFSFCFYKKYLLQKTFCKIKQNLFPESQFFRNQSAHVPICSAEFSFFFSRNGIPAIPRFKRCLLCLFYLHFHFITDFFSPPVRIHPRGSHSLPSRQTGVLHRDWKRSSVLSHFCSLQISPGAAAPCKSAMRQNL